MTIKHRGVCSECDWTGEPGLMNTAARDVDEHRDETGHAAKVERAGVTDGGVSRDDLKECWCCDGLHDSPGTLCPNCSHAGCNRFTDGCESDHKPALPDSGRDHHTVVTPQTHRELHRNLDISRPSDGSCHRRVAHKLDRYCVRMMGIYLFQPCQTLHLLSYHYFGGTNGCDNA